MAAAEPVLKGTRSLARLKSELWDSDSDVTGVQRVVKISVDSGVA